ncbi:MAG: carboxypeptidase-like regulatory domain-containing protein [Planctomycetaceae bacterium]|jgi:hypothetical protein|nr:carboxypeptidase-like regulatory domain-containing protein [Planctomycetaceae bacterium]
MIRKNIHRKFLILFFGFLCLSVFVFFGCSQKPKMYRCNGTVSLEGQLLEGAAVTFVNPNSASSSFGITDASGQFTFDSEIGEFEVSITKFKPNNSNNIYAKTENLLPDQYANFKTSGLKVTVSNDKSKNTFTFDLKK